MMHPVVVANDPQGNGKAAPGFCRGVVFLLVVLLLPLASDAGAGVSAVYTQSQGTTLVVEIGVGSPPPASLILVQTLPAGVNVLAAQPPASTADPGKGEAKWLLRDIAPGRFTIRMTLDKPVKAGDIAAEIRFKPAQGGNMQAMPVAKP